MPKRKVNSDDEIEVSRLKVTIPTTVPYMPMKLQLIRDCKVVLRRLKEPYICCDMPSLDDSTSSQHNSPYSYDLTASFFSDKNLNYVPGTPEDNRNLHLNSILTPEATPEAVTESTYPNGSTSISSWECSNALEEDPLALLNDFDEMSQLLVIHLLTRQFTRFAREMKRHTKWIGRKQLRICAQLLSRMPCEETIQCLREVLTKKWIKKKAEVVDMIKAIIVEVLISSVHEDFSANQSKCFDCLSLVKEFSLEICDDKVSFLDTHIKRLPLNLLLCYLYAIQGDPEMAVNRLKHNNGFILHILDGSVGNSKYFNMLSELLTQVFRKLQENNAHKTMLTLAHYILSKKLLPTGVEKWGTEILMALIQRKYRKKKVGSLMSKLLDRGVVLPEDVQRACVVMLLRAERQEGHNLFNSAPVYDIARECIPLMGPIKNKITLTLCDVWTVEEMHEALRRLCGILKIRKPYMNIDLSITIKSTSVDKSHILDCTVVRKIFLANDCENPMQRLSTALSLMQPQLHIANVNKNKVRIIPVTLAQHIKQASFC